VRASETEIGARTLSSLVGFSLSAGFFLEKFAGSRHRPINNRSEEITQGFAIVLWHFLKDSWKHFTEPLV
jgi:hypothetical protein